MREDASFEEWRELYDIAIRIKEMKPWEELWDMDLITILLKGKTEPCVCSVMGGTGECFAIAAYNGIEAIRDFFIIAENEDVPTDQLIRYQNNSMCYFGNRDELTKKELNIIKALGLKFRGKNNWIYFRIYEKGYAPYMPDRNEVIQLTDILQNLHMAIIALYKGTKVDFENGNTLLRRFDEESQLWLNYQIPLFIPEVKYPIIRLEDQLLVQRLKKQSANKSILELDIAYLNSAINDETYDKPIITRLCLLADNNGMIISQTMIEPIDDEIDIVLGTIVDYFLQNGKPKKIIVRDSYILSILTDLCKKVDVKLVSSGKLRGIDEFVESFFQHRF